MSHRHILDRMNKINDSLKKNISESISEVQVKVEEAENKKIKVEPGEDISGTQKIKVEPREDISGTQHDVGPILANNLTFNSLYGVRCDPVTGILDGSDSPYVMRVDNCVSLGQKCFWISDGRILYGPTKSGKSVIHQESSSVCEYMPA